MPLKPKRPLQRQDHARTGPSAYQEQQGRPIAHSRKRQLQDARRYRARRQICGDGDAASRRRSQPGGFSAPRGDHEGPLTAPGMDCVCAGSELVRKSLQNGLDFCTAAPTLPCLVPLTVAAVGRLNRRWYPVRGSCSGPMPPPLGDAYGPLLTRVGPERRELATLGDLRASAKRTYCIPRR
jgi:hypothetical protein